MAGKKPRQQLVECPVTLQTSSVAATSLRVACLTQERQGQHDPLQHLSQKELQHEQHVQRLLHLAEQHKVQQGSLGVESQQWPQHCKRLREK